MTWWHFICQLKHNATCHLDTVIIPFIHFCFGKSSHQEEEQRPEQDLGGPEDSTPKKGNRKSFTLYSPVKRYSSIPPLCLDAFAQLLGCELTKRTLPKLETTAIFSPKHFVTYHEDIFHSLSEVLEAAKHSGDMEKLQVLVIKISSVVANLASSGNSVDNLVVGRYLQFVESMASYENLVLTLAVMDEVRKLPGNILCSAMSWYNPRTTPVVAMMKVLLSSNMVRQLQNDAKNAKLHQALLQNFLKKGTSSKAQALDFLEEVMKIMENFTSAPEAFATGTWKIVATTLKEFIERHQEVSQIESSSEHNLGAAKRCLLYALLNFKDDPNKSLWKLFIELLKQVSSSASLVLSYNPPEIENELAIAMTRELKKSGIASIIHLTNFAKVAFTGLVANIPFKTLKIDPDAEQSSLQGIVQICADLASFLPQFGKDPECLGPAINICSAIALLLTNITEKNVVRPILKVLFRPISCLANDSLISLGKNYEEAVDGVFENSINFIQSRHEGPFNSELLGDVGTFIASAMSHKKRSMRAKAHEMWQLTFATSVKSLDIPDDIAQLLKKSQMLTSSESSQSSSGASQEDKKAQPTTFSGSFLNKTQPTATTKDQTGSVSPFKNFKKPAETNKKKQARYVLRTL